MPIDKVSILGSVSGSRGKAKYTQEAPGAGTRPEDEYVWTVLDLLVAGELELIDDKLWIRGSAGQTMFWDTATTDSDTGGIDADADSYTVARRAAAGIGLKVADPVLLDFTLNMANIAGTGGMSAPAVATSLTWSM
jgi:hypothetical protein